MRGYWSNPLRDAEKWWNEKACEEMTTKQRLAVYAIVGVVVTVFAWLWFKGIL